MYVCAGCMLAAKFASMLVQVACLHVRVCFLALVVCCAVCTAAQHYRAAIALGW